MDQPLKRLRILRVRGEEAQAQEVQFADERPLSLAVGGRVLTVLMATPGQERELAAGYALTMGWVRPGDRPPAVAFLPEQGRVELELQVSPEQLGVVRAAGGGLLGPPEADPLPPGGGLELAILRHLTEELAKAQVLYPVTRGTHAAALFDAAGALLAVAEDVGRHNGLDKAVGAAWLAGVLPRAAALALSGRCSLEMVLKTVRAGVPVVASVSAPTLPAVESAQALGLTLVNCPRPEEMKIYTHPQRLRQDGEPLPGL